MKATDSDKKVRFTPTSDNGKAEDSSQARNDFFTAIEIRESHGEDDDLVPVAEPPKLTQPSGFPDAIANKYQNIGHQPESPASVLASSGRISDAPSIDDPLKNLKSEIDEENRQKLAVMSSEDIEEALEEVRSQLDGKMLEFLRKRKEQKAEKTRKSSDKGLENLPDAVTEAIAASRVRMGPVEGSKLAWLSDADDTRAYSNELLSEVEAANEYMGPKSRLRFNLNGRALSREEMKGIPANSGLHHHGVDADLAGYTVPELLLLCRSTLTNQRSLALDVLTKIFERSTRSSAIGPSEDEVVDFAFLKAAHAEESVYYGYVGNSKSTRTSWALCINALAKVMYENEWEDWSNRVFLEISAMSSTSNTPDDVDAQLPSSLPELVAQDPQRILDIASEVPEAISILRIISRERSFSQELRKQKSFRPFIARLWQSVLASSKKRRVVEETLLTLEGLGRSDPELILEEDRIGGVLVFFNELDMRNCTDEDLRVIISALRLFRTCTERNAAFSTVVSVLQSLTLPLEQIIAEAAASELHWIFAIHSFLLLEAVARTRRRFGESSEEHIRVAELLKPLLPVANKFHYQGGRAPVEVASSAAAANFAGSLLHLHPSWFLHDVMNHDRAPAEDLDEVGDLEDVVFALERVNVEDDLLGIQEGVSLLALYSKLHGSSRIEPFVDFKLAQRIWSTVARVYDLCNRESKGSDWTQRSLWRCMNQCAASWATRIVEDTNISLDERRAAFRVALETVPRAGHPFTAVEIIRSVVSMQRTVLSSVLQVEPDVLHGMMVAIYPQIVEQIASGRRLSVSSTWLMDFLEPEFDADVETISHLLQLSAALVRCNIVDPSTTWRKLLFAFMRSEKIREMDGAQHTLTSFMVQCNGGGVVWNNSWEPVIDFIEEEVPFVVPAVAAAGVAAASFDSYAWSAFSSRGVEAVLDGAVCTSACFLQWVKGDAEDPTSVPRALSFLNSTEHRSKVLYAISTCRVGAAAIQKPSILLDHTLKPATIVDVLSSVSVSDKLAALNGHETVDILEVVDLVFQPRRTDKTNSIAKVLIQSNRSFADPLSVFLLGH